MLPTLADSLVLAGSVKKQLEELRDVQVILAPPTPWLVSVKEALHRHPKHLALAAQNIWPEDQGAFTGEASAYLLKDIVSYAIIGHSERRSYNSESNALISKKIQAALRWGISPIICVGEAKKAIKADSTVEEHEWSKLVNQLMDALEGVSAEQLDRILVAYEPVWAVGSNNPATSEYTLQVVERLRERVAKKYSASAAAALPFLYGGSVTAITSSDYLRYPQINGLLVGGASVKASEFNRICQHASLLRER